jgi:uncharacterized membrane protein
VRGYGYWNPGVGHGALTWSLFLILLAWSAVILLVFILFHHRGEHLHSIHYLHRLMNGHQRPALAMLEERLARGEITPHEFRIARNLLLGNSSSNDPP